GFRGPGPNNATPVDEASFCFNTAHCLNAEYVYKQRRMLCVSAQYFRTGVAYSRGVSRGAFDFSGTTEYPYPNNTKYGGDFSKPALLNVVNLGIGIKFFNKGFLAPVGIYKKFEVLYMMETLKYNNTNFLSKNTSVYPPVDTAITEGEGMYKYKNVAFAFTLGNQRALSDKIILDYGIRISYTPAVNFATLLAGDEFINDMHGEYRRAVNFRVFREQLINFHIGISFLAF
ncbi:MAG: hypothetical protein ACXVP4_10820, partial [Bacteroidia bacterium]